MKEALYLNGVKMDLLNDRGGKGKLPITRKIGDLTNPREASVDYSLQMQLPSTPKNDDFFEHARHVGSDTDRPYEVLEATYYSNGVPILQKGRAVLTSVGQRYAISVTSGNGDFWKSIEGLSLQDLDFSSESSGRRWNLSDMFTLRNATTDLVAPFMDWGALEDLPANRIDARGSFFCLYLSSIVRKIASASGYSLQGSVFLEGQYTNAVVTLDNTLGEEQFTQMTVDAEDSLPASHAYSLNLASGNGQLYFGTVTSDPYGLLEDQTPSILPAMELRQWSSLNFVSNVNVYSRYTALYTGEYAIQWSVTYNNFSTWSGLKDAVVVKNGSTNIDTVSAPDAIFPAASNTINRTTTVDLEKGDYIEIAFTVTGGTDCYVLNSTLDVTFTQTKDTEGKLEFGDPVSIAGCLPDISLIDFMKQFTQLYGVLLKVDNFAKTVRFFRISDIYSNKSSAYDWSSKLIARSEDYSSKYFSFAKKNWFRWLHDDDINYPTKAEGFADDYIQVNDNTLEAERTFVEMEFAASEDVTRSNVRTALVGAYSYDSSTGEFSSISYEPRILLLSLEAFSPSMTWTDGSGNSSTTGARVARFSQASFSDNMDFDTVIDKYYSELESMVDKPKIVTARFMLTEADINQFDFETPVYVTRFGSYFYVNEIKNYLPGIPTEVELVRLT